MKLVNCVNNLSLESLQYLQNDICNAGIMFTSGNKEYRAIFARGRASSKGGLKKIYAALYHAQKQEVINMIDALLMTNHVQKLSKQLIENQQ